MKIICLDTETTGFCEPEHRIVEVYHETWDLASRTKLGAYHQLIDPKRSMPAEAQRIHGISISQLTGQPDWEAIAPALHADLSTANLLVAQNAEFDFDFLNMEFKRVGLPALTMPYFCTMENGLWATPHGKKPNLEEICFALGVTYDKTLAHKADYDVGVMVDCFWRGVDWGCFDLSPYLMQAAA